MHFDMKGWALRASGAVLAAGLLTGCWQDFRKRVTLKYKEHTETIEWKKAEKEKLAVFDRLDEEKGVYQIPVSVAMKSMAAKPEMLAPLIEIKSDLSDMSLAQQGEQHFKITYACAGCHSLEGQRLVGPALNGRWGGDAPLEGGEVVKFDDEYFRESVYYSQAKISRGYPAAMPVFADTMTDEHFEAIKAYVKTFQ